MAFLRLAPAAKGGILAAFHAGLHAHGSQAARHPRLPRHAPAAGDCSTARGLQALNAAIAAGGISRADGSAQAEALREALVTRDRKRVYRIDDGIPVLLAEEAIATGQVAGFPAA